MSEFDDLVDGFDGLGAPSSEGERRVDAAEVAGSTPAGPMQSSDADGTVVWEADEPPHFDDDWPEQEPEQHLEKSDPTPSTADLRVLRPDHRPQVGVHFVVFDGIPRPVIRAHLTLTEDEFVRDNIGDLSDLHGDEGLRRIRADRALRLRYRGYLCGEIAGL